MELLKEDGCIGEKAFHGEKECFFQPFYNVEKKRIWGAEALFRLKDENGNYQFYGRFNQGVVTINLPDVALTTTWISLQQKRKKKDGSLRSTDGCSGKPAEGSRS